jgi:D-alanyl-D-alanine carboxypeptidase
MVLARPFGPHRIPSQEKTMAHRSPSKRRISVTVVSTLAAAAALSACAAPSETALRVDQAGGPATTRQLTTLMRQDVAAGAPGVVVRVNDGRKTVSLARQAAWTKPDHTLTTNDQFRMGSNTKTMVAVVALQLVAEHKLSLTDPVEKWLPGQVPNGRGITLRMMMNHTSGLFDYIGDPTALAKVIGADPSPVTPEQLLAIAAKHPALFKPGAEYSYSNTNYTALGLVLEKASGHALESLLRHRIIEPLGLHDTYLATSGASRDGEKLADAYEPDAAHVAPLLPPGVPKGTAFAGPARGDHTLVTSLNPQWAWAAGALVSTQADEQKFLRALASGKLLPAAQLAEMKTTVVEKPGDANSARYGLAYEKYLSPCGPVWGHTGGIPGYSTVNYTDDTGKRAVSVASTTLFGLHEKTLGAADQKVVDAAICTMYDKPLPASTH